MEKEKLKEKPIEESIKLDSYLANFSKNHDLDKTFFKWCFNNNIAYQFYTKAEWDTILQQFLDETE